MQFHKFRNITLGLVLALSGMSSAHASSLITFVGHRTTADFGTTSADGTINSINREGPGYSARAQALFGVNRAFASGNFAPSLEFSTAVQADAAWSVNFNLLGVARGATVPITINIDYDFSIIAVGDGGANFRLIVNSVDTVLFARTQNRGFGGDACPLVPGTRPIGSCAGPHAGTVSRTLQYSAGPNQVLSLTAIAQIGLAGTTDAYNTARVTSVVIPDGVTFEYVDVAGNPLNVRNASQTGGADVPEPATLGMLAAGMGGILLAKAKRGRMKAKQEQLS